MKKQFKGDKVSHVKKAKDPGGHVCHWPGCGKACKPAYWGCYSCWMRLPKRLHDKIWEAYRVGQEIDKQPSREYLEVAQEVQDWIYKNYPETRKYDSH